MKRRSFVKGILAAAAGLGLGPQVQVKPEEIAKVRPTAAHRLPTDYSGFSSVAFSEYRREVIQHFPAHVRVKSRSLPAHVEMAIRQNWTDGSSAAWAATTIMSAV